MRRSIGHAPGRTRRTHPAIFARKSDKQLVAAGRTADPGEAVAKDAAAQIPIELRGDEGREVAAGIALGGFAEERGQVLADDAVEQRPFGLPPLVTKLRTSWTFRRGRRLRCQSEHRGVPITSHARVITPSLYVGGWEGSLLDLRPAAGDRPGFGHG